MSHLRQKIQELEQKNLMLHQKAVISVKTCNSEWYKYDSFYYDKLPFNKSLYRSNYQSINEDTLS